MKTEMPEYIATNEILWLCSDGTEKQIVVRVGLPYQVEPGGWACPASLDGVDGRYPDIIGESSLQSLCLAIALIARRLRLLVDDEERLVYPQDRSCPWDLTAFTATFGYGGESKAT